MAVPLRTLLLVFGLTLVQPASAHRKLLVFLLDGFRSDYISDEALESLPGFKEIVSKGVKVDYLTPDFPSLSYPNYYTLMTETLGLEICVLIDAYYEDLASAFTYCNALRGISLLENTLVHSEVIVLSEGWKQPKCNLRARGCKQLTLMKLSISDH